MADVLSSEASFVPGERIIPPAVRLALYVLGPPQIWVNGEPAIEVRGQKMLSLLAYLALEAGRAHRRDVLAARFWPDQPEEQGFQNLRQTLARLRRALDDAHANPPHLLIEPQTIRFNRHSDYWLDVEAFRALLATAERHPHRRLEVCPTCLSQLARAVELYRGELLAEIHPVGSPTLDEWLLLARERLGQQACTALHALSEARLAQGDARWAARFTRQLLRLEPWNEAALRRLLCALAQDEGRNAALREYQTFRRALMAELGVEPEDETVALATILRGGALPQRTPCTVATSLPAPGTLLVGRQAELHTISGQLAGRERRLLVLYGPGGCGKTRLALEIAAGQARMWRDGVWFIPLAEIASSEAFTDAIASALGLQVDGHFETKQLLESLHPKELLLLLDSFEHLAASATVLSDIVRSAPEVRIVVTSRSRLGVREEWAMRLDGLKVPEETATVAEAEAAVAVQLFLENARRVAPAFHLTPENVAHVIRICCLVEGLPLGIELAAAWARLYSPQQIADRIEGSLDFLRSPEAGRMQRHSSLRGTFDSSYALLSEAQRRLLSRASVFRGGFTLEAVRQVTGADPAAVDALLDRSLLQISPDHRLDLHLTLREYAAEKLAADPVGEAAAHDRHSRYYLAFLQEREAAITGAAAKSTLDEIHGEIGNVRAAWRWAATAGLADELASSLEALAGFYNLKSYLHEAEAAFGDAAARVGALADSRTSLKPVVCRLLVHQASFLRRRGDYAAAIQVAQAAIAQAQAAGEVLREAQATLVWGEALWRQGEYGASRGQLERGLALARDLRGSHRVVADGLNSLAGVCWRQGDYAGAQRCLEECLHLPSHAGRTRPRSIVLGNLGVVAVEQGDYTAAKSCYRQALDIEREIGEVAGESVSLNNLGNLSLYLGAYTEAETYYQQALAINRETGAREYEGWTLGNVALLAHYQGRQDAAQGYAREALQISQEIGDRAMQATMWLELGHALTGLERWTEAAEAYRGAVAIRRELNQSVLATEPLAGLAWVCLAQGELELARLHAKEILHHLTSAPDPALAGTLSPFQVYLTCYRVLQAIQDPCGPEILCRAHALLRERAARIADENLRRSFVENVAAHRELVQAFENVDGSPVDREQQEPCAEDPHGVHRHSAVRF